MLTNISKTHSNFDSFGGDVESALYAITECGISTNSMEEYYEKIHQIISKLTYAKNFYIALHEEKTGTTRFVYFVDEKDEDLNVKSLGEFNQHDLSKTMTGYLIRKRKLMHFSKDDFYRLDRQGEISLHGSDSNDWLGVPLMYNDELLGAMVIQSYREDIAYGKKEENVLQFVSRQIALLLKSKLAEQQMINANHLLEERVQKRTEDLNRANAQMRLEIEERKKSEKIQNALFKITDLASTANSLQDFFKEVHDIISTLMYAKNEYIALLSDSRESVVFPYFVDLKDGNPKKRKVDLNAKNLGKTEQVLKNGEAILFNRTSDDSSSPLGSDSTSYIGVPLKEKGEVFGVLAVQSYDYKNTYDEKDKETLTTIGIQVATAILRKKDADSLLAAREHLESRVKERTSELEETIVKRRKIEEKLEHESLHDALTGLPNRLYFSNLLNDLIESVQADHHYAVLFLDLDRFKLINDSLGHHIGDLFLIEIAKRLKGCLRQNDVVARLGGDEFCILMKQVTDQKSAINLATRILRSLKQSVDVDKHSLMTSASIGIRLVVDEEITANVAMSDADAAMYQAKHQGKNCFCLFDSEIKSMVADRMKIENDLRRAIHKNELYLVYQPVVDLDTHSVVGFEALIRWEHPERGQVFPDQFIPVAEETGIIVEIGEFVAEQTAKKLEEFAASEATSKLFININVSAMQILSQTFDQFIRTLLYVNTFESNLFNIEITESILIEDYKAATNFVREMKALGLNIYLDDFGTGYSSLSYLHQFPFDVIKLDKSFTDSMQDGERNKAIVESISSMANKMEMKIVAEGVETKEQLKLLKDLGYRYGQGYFFSKPLKEEAIQDFLDSF